MGAAGGDLRVLERTRERTVVALDDGALAGGLAELRWRLDELLDGGQEELVVDIAGVATVTSTTLSALLLARRRCHARDGRLLLRRPSRAASAVLRRSGLGPVFGLEAQARYPA